MEQDLESATVEARTLDMEESAGFRRPSAARSNVRELKGWPLSNDGGHWMDGPRLCERAGSLGTREADDDQWQAGSGNGAHMGSEALSDALGDSPLFSQAHGADPLDQPTAVPRLVLLLLA